MDREIINLHCIEHDHQSLRDYFAGQALAGLLTDGEIGLIAVADTAYLYADAMLLARKQK